MNPVTAGLSLSYGQTQQAQTPQGLTCKGQTVSIAAAQLTYGTTNNQIADISPAGNICAGTWNRNTGGGIADYTYCNAPNPVAFHGRHTLPGRLYNRDRSLCHIESGGGVYPRAYHHGRFSLALVGTGFQQCYSQGQTAQLDSQACYSQNGKQVLLCAPSSITSGPSSGFACPLPSGVSGRLHRPFRRARRPSAP